MKSSLYSLFALLLALCMATMQAQEVRQITPANPTQGEGFGQTIETDGDIIVITSRFTRQAHIYTWEGVRWENTTSLKGTNEKVHANLSKGFGESVAIHNNYIAVGAPGSTIGAEKNVGLVELFTKTDGEWTLDQVIRSPRPLPKTNFGQAVAISDNVMLVGAPAWEYQTGQAFVYVKEGDNWVGTELENPKPKPTAQFGGTVAIHGDLLFVGAPGHMLRGKPIGALYTYQQNAEGNWTLVNTMQGNGNISQFGQAIEVNGNIVAVGAYDNVLLYAVEGNELNQIAKLGNPDAGGALSFATHLSFSPDGNHLVVGSYGAAYLFSNLDGQWNMVNKVTSEATGFGTNNTAGNGFFLINSPYEGSDYINGAVYLHEIQPLLNGLMK